VTSINGLPIRLKVELCCLGGVGCPFLVKQLSGYSECISPIAMAFRRSPRMKQSAASRLPRLVQRTAAYVLLILQFSLSRYVPFFEEDFRRILRIL